MIFDLYYFSRQQILCKVTSQRVIQERESESLVKIINIEQDIQLQITKLDTQQQLLPTLRYQLLDRMINKLDLIVVSLYQINQDIIYSLIDIILSNFNEKILIVSQLIRIILIASYQNQGRYKQILFLQFLITNLTSPRHRHRKLLHILCGLQVELLLYKPQIKENPISNLSSQINKSV
ncbi:hypothetical protein pb186bvf_001543 [Paramecium bursaria]